MMIIHRMKPQYKGMYESLSALFLLALVCIYANNKIDGANYMYLAGYKDGAVAGNNIINYLPKGQFKRLGILALIGTALFHLVYFIYLRLTKRKNKAV